MMSNTAKSFDILTTSLNV